MIPTPPQEILDIQINSSLNEAPPKHIHQLDRLPEPNLDRFLGNSYSQMNIQTAKLERFNEERYHNRKRIKSGRVLQGMNVSSLEHCSDYTKRLYCSIDQWGNQRASSAKPVNIKGIKYKFTIMDLNKYSNDIKYGRFNWPVHYVTVGKKINNPKARKEALVTEIHFDRLLRILKETDWADSPLYQIFLEHGRWKHTVDEIYSELELKYLYSSLTNMVREGDPNFEEFNQNEGLAIISRHWLKTVNTLEHLMNLMNMMYYF